MQGQHFGRLATVNEKGDPHVVPAGYRYNPELDTIDISGHNIAPTKWMKRNKAKGAATSWHISSQFSQRPAELSSSPDVQSTREAPSNYLAHCWEQLAGRPAWYLTLMIRPRPNHDIAQIEEYTYWLDKHIIAR